MERLLISVGLLLLVGAQARAQQDARSYFERATAQFALGKYADAAGNFEKSFELRPDPAILYNAAQARRLSGDKTRALQLYLSYVRLYGARIDNRAEVMRHIEDLRAGIAKDQQVASAPPITTKPPPAVDEPPRMVEKPAVVEPKPAPVTVAVAAAPPSRGDKPLVKKGWFWGVVVGAVAVVAVGVSLGVAYGTPAAQNPTPSFGTARGN